MRVRTFLHIISAEDFRSPELRSEFAVAPPPGVRDVLLRGAAPPFDAYLWDAAMTVRLVRLWTHRPSGRASAQTDVPRSTGGSSSHVATVAGSGARVWASIGVEGPRGGLHVARPRHLQNASLPPLTELGRMCDALPQGGVGLVPMWLATRGEDQCDAPPGVLKWLDLSRLAGGSAPEREGRRAPEIDRRSRGIRRDLLGLGEGTASTHVSEYSRRLPNLSFVLGGWLIIRAILVVQPDSEIPDDGGWEAVTDPLSSRLPLGR